MKPKVFNSATSRAPHRARRHGAEEDRDAGEGHEPAEESYAQPQPPEHRCHLGEHLPHVHQRHVGVALCEQVLHLRLAPRRQARGGEAALRRLLQHARLDDDEEVDAEGAPVDGAQAGDGDLDRHALDVEDEPRAEADAELARVVLLEAHFVPRRVAP
ncbi:MAG TPA: hypothetical protein VFS60_05005, partial [Thermoanaerobaculia bacterium]|nr:hypothetical protein [Thermoanaerobaculia bacterium]